jgi:hypothetical protein
MGRGVASHSYEHRGITLFLDFEDDSDREVFNWDDYTEYIIEKIKEVAPSVSLVKNGEWYGRETQRIGENRLMSVWISEYMDVVRISFVAEHGNLGETFIDKVVDKISEKFVKGGSTVLIKQGTFSNGESVYTVVKK